ncbi:sodium:solute symporter [Prochlorococcus sp. MIT 1341]|uniref:sodium/glutamate symporter n=1 Tax=Prochlorococcus sp. MIT 1341 TaxID=3096221 RepID=UPI002A762689|nr:sodium:solute symporter [Prochlorococcus sp. MIT 1341]
MLEIQPTANTSIGLAFVLLILLGFLLGLGRRLEPAIRLEQIGIPIALVAGLCGLILGPYGFLPVLPQGVTDIWTELPSPLLTLVFGTLLIGRPLPKGKGLVQPVASQALLGLLLGFGQYLVGGLVVIFFLIPFQGVDPLMGCLIEVGFEGGHGAAAVMGDSFQKLGFLAGKDLGLAMATVGLLASTIIGSLLVVLGRLKGWGVNRLETLPATSSLLEESDVINLSHRFRQLAVNLALPGLAVGFAVLMLNLLRSLSPFFGDIYEQVWTTFPVFPLALLGSLLVRFALERLEQTEIVSHVVQREIGTLCTDLLIITAMASINLPILIADWVPITALSLAGLIWNLTVMLFFSKLIFNIEWFERSLTEFGNATGVAASGLLLLRLADPRSNTNALPVFSIKQLFVQPLLSGGVITVLAPIGIINFGLMGWTEISGVITFLFFIIAILIRQ